MTSPAERLQAVATKNAQLLDSLAKSLALYGERGDDSGGRLVEEVVFATIAEVMCEAVIQINHLDAEFSGLGAQFLLGINANLIAAETPALTGLATGLKNVHDRHLVIRGTGDTASS